jgi:hypothetical protein
VNAFRLLLTASLLASGMGFGSGCAAVGNDPVPAAAAAAPTQTSAVQPSDEQSAAETWKQIGEIIGKPGQTREGVYTITIPRDDLIVRIDGMDVPTAAGIESVFRFYRCSCGKTVVVGQFVVPDYEANDVSYALQKDNLLISSMAPFLIYDKPRMMAVRFQAEGKPDEIARAIKSALGWTGKNRMPAKNDP